MRSSRSEPGLGIVFAIFSAALIGSLLAVAPMGAQQRSAVEQAASETQAGRQTHHTFRREIRRELRLEYLLSLPEGYLEEGASWPLVLFLHGAGERGDDLDRVKTHGPPKLIEQGQKIPAVVVSPQCPTNGWWTDHLEALDLLLDELIETHHIDEQRIYLTGLSMGGYGTWALAAAHPERFAAAAPICGGGSRIAAFRLRELPIWAFHGEADPVVPVEETVDLVELIEKRGGTRIRSTIYPGVGHDSWTKAYDDPLLWEWLFAQRRSGP